MSLRTEVRPTDVRPVGAPGEGTDVDRPCHVVLWNDPVTPMQVVTRALKKIFGYPQEEAERLMLLAHNEGKAAVWSGTLAKAEHYCVRLAMSGLQATVARD